LKKEKSGLDSDVGVILYGGAVNIRNKSIWGGILRIQVVILP